MTVSKKMKTIDMTPTWRALLPALVEVAVRGTSVDGRKQAMDALYELADFVDRANARAKAAKKSESVEDVTDAVTAEVLRRNKLAGIKPDCSEE